MSTHRRHVTHPALPTSQGSLWPLEAAAPNAPSSLESLPSGCAGAETTADEAVASPRRRRTPSFVCEIPLRVGPAKERALEARLEGARALYNACLGEARKRWLLVKQSRTYQHARTLPRHTPERTEAFRATRAYRAVLRVAVGQAKRVRFKGRNQLDTVEGKSNETGLVWRSDRVVWRGLSLSAYLPGHRTQKDAVLVHGLAAPVKYVRLVRRRIGERTRYFAQLITGGRPYQKPQHPLGQGRVGLDLGPSTVAVVADAAARLEPFCAELDPQAAQIRREQRHLDRQRRANNPGNYLPNGTVKKGHRGRKHWRESGRQHKTRVRSRSCGRRGSRPIPPINRRVGEPQAPPTCGGLPPACVRAGRPQQVRQPTPRVRML